MNWNRILSYLFYVWQLAAIVWGYFVLASGLPLWLDVLTFGGLVLASISVYRIGHRPGIFGFALTKVIPAIYLILCFGALFYGPVGPLPMSISLMLGLFAGVCIGICITHFIGSMHRSNNFTTCPIDENKDSDNDDQNN
tara:strand:+ start:40 stop:456 length:417 start_codon:yes stop_codon:yes gene_type:complete